jgi:hypothetical protein
MKILTILLLITLILVIYYDFRYMAVPIVLLLCTGVLSFIRLFRINPVNTGLHFAAINVTGCLGVILFSFLVLFIIRLRVFNPLNVLIGTGDLLFFPAVCFSFSPVNFIVFFILSLAILLLVKSFFLRSRAGFPLAGGISALMFVVLLSGILIPVNLYNDGLMIKMLLNGC